MTYENPWPRWASAMETALYGDAGFYRADGPGTPAAHFRTSVHASAPSEGGRGLFGRAVARLLAEVDAGLGSPARLDLVDVGAGRGELLAEVDAALAAAGDPLRSRLRMTAVEAACPADGVPPPGVPDDCPPAVAWRRTLPPPHSATGLLFANEWLDNVPLDIAECDPRGAVRYVHVSPATGEERLGGPVSGSGPDSRWLQRWWHPLRPGGRAEIGRPRDTAWAAAVAALDRGTAVAVDYAHGADARPDHGTLAAFRDGFEVLPVPDGTCDLTAHVALDACAAHAAEATGRVAGSGLALQRDALRALGVRGARPEPALAAEDPLAYLRGLADAGEAAELTDESGLGGFWWLRQDVVPAPVEPAPAAAAPKIEP